MMTLGTGFPPAMTWLRHDREEGRLDLLTPMVIERMFDPTRVGSDVGKRRI
jgi:hypothetical protein